MTDHTEFKRLAEESLGEWYVTGELRYEDRRSGDLHGLHHDDERFITAANPAAVLELIAENEALQKDAESRCEWANEAAAEIDRLQNIEAENDELRRDAQRYRWLRQYEFDIGSYHGIHEHNAAAWFEHISDEAIDTAIAEEAQFAKESDHEQGA